MEASLPVPSTAVREPEKVERFRSTITPRAPMLSRISAELDQPRFVRVQRKAELGQPFPQFLQELPGHRVAPCSSISITIRQFRHHAASSQPEQLIEGARQAGLDGICVTDHLFIKGAETAQMIGAQLGFPVFRGIEARSTLGDTSVNTQIRPYMIS